MSKIVIFGSSRSFGSTRKAVNQIVSDDIQVIDLKTLNIVPYDYEYLNQSDDFIPTIEHIITFETLILATPVYWYTMSATMKIFIDRISDLLDIRKDLGRKLRGKKMFVITSFDTSYPKGFEDTFEQICEYLNIEYLGTSFIYSGTKNTELIKNNIAQIEKARAILM